jgi:opacity protein-like surface antigen
MRRFALITAMIAILTTLLSAADIAGKWTGQFDFNGDAVPLTFDLKTSGTTLTGTVNGLPTANAPIKDGKIDGNTVTFWMVTDYQGTDVKLVYTGKISADKIDFTMGTEDGGFSVSFAVKRPAA